MRFPNPFRTTTETKTGFRARGGAAIALACALAAPLAPTSALAGPASPFTSHGPVAGLAGADLLTEVDGKRGYGKRHYGKKRYGRHGGYRQARFCRPGRAIRKARRLGLYGTYVRRINRRAIVVVGYRHRGAVRVRVGRGPGCPILNVRRIGGHYY